MSRSCEVKPKFWRWIFFCFNSTHDPTLIKMANRDNDDDKNGRKKRNFNIDDDAFASDDGLDFMSDDEFEHFVNPRQKKKLGTREPKDLSLSRAKERSQPSVAPVPEPVEAPKPTKPALQPCIGCRQPFLRIKRPISLNGPKFPYENECDYCGPCRSAIFAQLKDEEDCNSSQPVFYNPVVTHIEAKSTSSTTVVMSSTSAAVPASLGLAPQIQPRTESDFGSRLRTGMASRNELLGQSEITGQTDSAMATYRAKILDRDTRSSGVTSTPQSTVEVPKAKGSMAPPPSGHGGSIAVTKKQAAAAPQAKESTIPHVERKKEAGPSLPSCDNDPPVSSSRPSGTKMVLKQGPIPKKGRQEAELAELLADEERKKDADKIMIWRKLQTEIAKTASFANE